MSQRQLVYVLVAALLVSGMVSAQPLYGGITVGSVKSAEAKEAAAFCMSKLNAKKLFKVPSVKLVAVTKFESQSQVVQGFKFYLKLKVKGSNGRTYYAKCQAQQRSWMKPAWKLLSLKRA